MARCAYACGDSVAESQANLSKLSAHPVATLLSVTVLHHIELLRRASTPIGLLSIALKEIPHLLESLDIRVLVILGASILEEWYRVLGDRISAMVFIATAPQICGRRIAKHFRELAHDFCLGLLNVVLANARVIATSCEPLHPV